jgi:flavin reductase (DIM6/NTAB) family NADH-FMN oxidoreductase RutF
VVKGTGKFVLNMPGKDQKGAAFAFFKPAKVEDGKLSGLDYHPGHNGAPVLNDAIAAVECSIRQIVSMGDHDIVGRGDN